MAVASLESVYAISESVVARDIEGSLVIIPLVAGIGDMEDELYTLNETGYAIWRKFDGVLTLGRIVQELTAEYSVDEEVLQRDVLGLTGELLGRHMLTDMSKD